MDIKGVVKTVLPLQSGTSAKGEWKRQTVVVEFKEGNFTSCVALDNVKNVGEFGTLNIGDECTFKCDTPTSREYNGRWYTSINCWGWDVENKAEVQPMPEPTPQPTVTAEPTAKDDVEAPF